MVRLASVVAFAALILSPVAFGQLAPIRSDALFDIGKEAEGRVPIRPAIAYDGAGTFLVAWQQGRRFYEQQQADIMAARVDRSGRVLDTQPLVLSKGTGSHEAPQVEFSNGVFLVVWQDYRSGKHWDVYGARIGTDGRILDATGFAIAAESENQALPQIAPAPGGFLVVWQAMVNGYYQIRGASVSAQGTVAAFSLTHAGKPLYGGDPALARTASGWLLSWKDERAWTGSGTGIITRRFARLAGDSGRPNVTQVQIAPAIWLGGAGGRLIGTANRGLYVSSEVAGRGQRVWTSALLDGSTAAPLPNPNAEVERKSSGWDTSRMIPVVSGNLPVDGMVAGDFGCSTYLLVVRGLMEGKWKQANALLVARLGVDGRRMDNKGTPTALYESVTPVGNPVLRFGGGVFLLAFEERDRDGRGALRGSVLKCDPP